MSEQIAANIEAKLDKLIQRYQHLYDAYQEVSKREASLVAERARLIEKNEIARTRIEAMIPRMKQLEAASE